MTPEVARTCEICGRTPDVFRALLHGLDERWTEHDYGPLPDSGGRTWSAHEIIAHMVFNERTDWLPRIRWVLEHADAAPFVPFDITGHKPLVLTRTLHELLDTFADERRASLAQLESLGLAAADMARPGLHPALGPVQLRHLLGAWIVHDLNHIAQVCKAVAHQARSDTGPWEQYLSVLSPPNPLGPRVGPSSSR